MARRVVERGEVVVVELHLGPLDDPEPEPHEDVLELAPGGGDQVQVADLDRGRRAASRRPPPRPGCAPARGTRAPRPAPRPAPRAPAGSRCPRCRPRARCSGASSGIERRIDVSSALRPRYLTRSSSSSAAVRGLEHRPLRLLGDLLEALERVVARVVACSAAAGSGMAGTIFVQAEGGGHRDVQRIGAVAARPGRVRSRRRRPRRPRAGRPARSRARTAPAPSSATSRSGRPAPGTRAIARRPRRADSKSARATGCAEHGAHAGAHRLRAERVGRARAQHDARGSERLRRPQHRPDVPGIARRRAGREPVRASVGNRCRRRCRAAPTPRSRASRCRAIPRRRARRPTRVTRSVWAGSRASSVLELLRGVRHGEHGPRHGAVAQRRRRACPRPRP